MPPNDGCYRPLHVIVPPRHACSAPIPIARWSAAITRPRSASWTPSSRRSLRCFPIASPPAARPPPGVLIFGARRPDGRWAVLYEVHGGGEGATASKDGASAVRVHMSNVMNTPVEVIEGEYPLMVEEQALRLGSGGDGAHRGGLGLPPRLSRAGPEVTLTSMLERRIVPPYGLFGGKAAARRSGSR